MTYDGRQSEPSRRTQSRLYAAQTEAHIDALIEKIAESNAAELEKDGVVIACGMSKFAHDACVAAVFERADEKMYENKNLLKGNS